MLVVVLNPLCPVRFSLLLYCIYFCFSVPNKTISISIMTFKIDKVFKEHQGSAFKVESWNAVNQFHVISSSINMQDQIVSIKRYKTNQT